MFQNDSELKDAVMDAKTLTATRTGDTRVTSTADTLPVRGAHDSDDAVLAVEDLSFSYGRIRILRGVNMKIVKGRITCVMGRNGVGKTTLMKNIIGSLKPNMGTIRLKGKDVTGWRSHHRIKAGLSIVPQGRHIFPKLTVEENLRIGLEGNKRYSEAIPADIYDMFPFLKDMRRRMGGDLSGGQQQQLAIARAMAGNPDVLLLDEPTEGIQPTIIQRIGEVIRSFVEERNMTVVLVEQFVGFVQDFGDDVKIMERGRVVAETSASGLTDELVHRHLGL